MARIKKILLLISPFCWGLFALVLVAGFGGYLLYFVHHSQFMLENGLQWRDVFFVIFGAIGIGLAVWRSMVAGQQIEIAERGLIQDRYQSAANMLGSNSMATRMGGVDALESIANKHDNYYIRIINLFAAVIRQPVESVVTSSGDIKPSPDDVRKAMVFIVKRTDRQKAIERKHKKKVPHWHIDLRGAYLACMILTGSNLSELELIEADLTYARLMDANLTEVNLRDAILKNTNLSNANLANARGIKQTQLNEACYYKGYPPNLKGAMCAKHKKQLNYDDMRVIEPK